MKIKFDVTPKEFIIVKDILEKYLQDDGKAWVFGSRAKSSSLIGSDLDLAIECQDKVALKLLSQIKIAFEDSRLPYRVDVVDMKAVKPYFKDLIKDEMIVLPLNHFSKVPTLRFSTFSSEWEGSNLVNISQRVIVGLATSVTEYYTNESTSSVPILRNTNIKKGYFDDEKILHLTSDFSSLHPNKRVKAEDLIIVHTGSNVGLACVVPKKYDGAQTFTTLIVTLKTDIISSYFLNYVFNSAKGQYQALKLVVGGGKGNLNTGDLKIYPVKYPQLEEQQKIASFLTQIDNKIEQFTKKKQLLADYKKGVMQQIFSQEIRFKQDDGSDYPDWEVKKLGGFIIEHKGGAPLQPKDFVKWSTYEVIPKKAIQNGGFLKLDINSPTFCSKEFFDSYNKSIVNKDYLITTLRDLVPSAPSIGYIVKIKTEKSYLLAQGVYGLMINKEKIMEDFLIHLSNTHWYRRIMKTIKVGSTQVHIRNNDFFNIRMNTPFLEEQQKIANFLTEIDTQINQVEKQLAGTKQFKNGLLQQMFV